jgi:hypothetical protein
MKTFTVSVTFTDEITEENDLVKELSDGYSRLLGVIHAETEEEGYQKLGLAPDEQLGFMGGAALFEDKIFVSLDEAKELSSEGQLLKAVKARMIGDAMLKKYPDLLKEVCSR